MTERKEWMIGKETQMRRCSAVKREGRDMRVKGGEGGGKDTRQLPHCPAIHFRVSATEMYPGIKTFLASSGDGCEDIKSHLISDAKNSSSRLRFCLPRADKLLAFWVKEGKSVGPEQSHSRK